MTAREKRQLENLKSLVTEALEKVNENDGYYVVDVSHLIEEMAIELDFDTTFNDDEQRKLKSFGYRLNANKTEATQKFKTTPVKVEKFGFEQFTLVFGKQKRFSHLGATDLGELNDAKTTSRAFKNLYKDYINE